MIPEIEPLRKILELEKARGYRDSAVIGGLDRYLVRLRGEARSVEGPLSGLLLESYSELDRARREQWVESVLGQLVGSEGELRPGPGRGEAVPPLDSPITTVKGISSSLASRFSRLGVMTVRDLLYLFPHRHIDYSKMKRISELEGGLEQSVVASVWEARETSLGGRRGTEAIVGDETGNIRAAVPRTIKAIPKAINQPL